MVREKWARVTLKRSGTHERKCETAGDGQPDEKDDGRNIPEVGQTRVDVDVCNVTTAKEGGRRVEELVDSQSGETYGGTPAMRMRSCTPFACIGPQQVHAREHTHNVQLCKTTPPGRARTH